MIKSLRLTTSLGEKQIRSLCKHVMYSFKFKRYISTTMDNPNGEYGTKVRKTQELQKINLKAIKPTEQLFLFLSRMLLTITDNEPKEGGWMGQQIVMNIVR